MFARVKKSGKHHYLQVVKIKSPGREENCSTGRFHPWPHGSAYCQRGDRSSGKILSAVFGESASGSFGQKARLMLETKKKNRPGSDL